MKNLPQRLAVLITALLIAGFTVYFVGATYPYVGSDFKYFLPRLIDTHLHYLVDGLSIQWYTPSFGGGLPAYPNPQHIQFSIPQFFTLFVNPWIAVLAYFFLCSLAATLGAYAVCRRILGFEHLPALLGAAFFSINGYLLEHMAIGHVGHAGFALLPLLLLLLLDPDLPPLLAGVLISILSAALVYSGGFYPAVFMLLSISICLPLVYLIRPAAFQWKRLGQAAGWGLGLAVSINISKIWAVLSFMRMFPRELSGEPYDVPLRTALSGLLMQLFGSMTLVPYYALTGQNVTTVRNMLQVRTGAYAGLWELDLSLSPILWLVLLAGGTWCVAGLISRRRSLSLPRQASWWIAAALLAFTSYVAVEAALNRGLIYPLVRTLPILRSLNVNPRFGSAFLFPLALLGAWIIQNGVGRWKPARLASAILLAITLLSMGAFLLLPLPAMQERSLDVSRLVVVYDRIMQNGERFPVEVINSGVNDTLVFEKHASDIKTYEVIFGYKMGKFQPLIRRGSVWEVQDGYFNMTDPTGYVYPEANGTQPFERIPAGDRDKLEDFVNRRQPDWKLPLSQQAGNWLSLLALAFDLGVMGYFGVRKAGRGSGR
jgi:hypothetical protein